MIIDDKGRIRCKNFSELGYAASIVCGKQDWIEEKRPYWSGVARMLNTSTTSIKNWRKSGVGTRSLARKIALTLRQHNIYIREDEVMLNNEHDKFI